MRKIRGLGEKIILLSLYAVIIALAFYLKLPCIWRFLFKVPCPGCGMTRAVYSVLCGDMAAAFSLHPMVFSLPLLFLYFLFDGRLFKKKQTDRLVLFAILTGFLVQWIGKLLFYIL